MLGCDLLRKVYLKMLVNLRVVQNRIVKMIQTERKGLWLIQLIDVFFETGIYAKIANESTSSENLLAHVNSLLLLGKITIRCRSAYEVQDPIFVFFFSSLVALLEVQLTPNLFTSFIEAYVFFIRQNPLHFPFHRLIHFHCLICCLSRYYHYHRYLIYLRLQH